MALPKERRCNLQYYLERKNHLCDVKQADRDIDILKTRFNKVLMWQIKKVYLQIYQIKHLQENKGKTLEVHIFLFIFHTNKGVIFDEESVYGRVKNFGR